MPVNEFYKVNVGTTEYAFNPELNEVIINSMYTKSYVLLPKGDLLIFNIKSGELKNAKVYSRGSDLSRSLVAKIIEKDLLGDGCEEKL